jgi:hypothetical protein
MSNQCGLLTLFIPAIYTVFAYFKGSEVKILRYPVTVTGVSSKDEPIPPADPEGSETATGRTGYKTLFYTLFRREGPPEEAGRLKTLFFKRRPRKPGDFGMHRICQIRRI